MPRLPVRMKLAYGVSDFGFSVAGTIVGIYLLKFVVDVVGLRPSLAGAALLIGKIWDAVIDPFIGRYSDSVKSRWGRRRPFLLWFAAPYGATFIMVWFLPTLANQWLLAALFALLNMLFITFYSLLMVPYNALAPEITRDYDERTSITSYRMAFSIIGGLVAAGLPMIITAQYGDQHLGHGVMGFSFGVLIALFPLFAFLGTKEQTDVCPLASAPSILAGIRAVWANKPFLLSLTAFLVNWVALDVIQATFLFYLVYWMRLTEAGSQPILLTIFATAAICLPLWVWISKRIGKKAAYMAGLGYLTLVLTTLIFLPPGKIWLIFLAAFAAGIGVSAAHVLPYAIIPDAIEYDEYKSGQNREGIYFGFVTFLQQFASSGALFLVGLILDLAGYIPNASQTPQALWAIRLLLGAFPGLLFLVGFMAMAFYPITRAEYTRIVAALAERQSGRGQNLGM